MDVRDGPTKGITLPDPEDHSAGIGEKRVHDWICGMKGRFPLWFLVRVLGEAVSVNDLLEKENAEKKGLFGTRRLF